MLKALRIAAKLESYRESIKAFYGQDYPVKVTPYQEVLRVRMEQEGESEVDAMIALVTELQDAPGGYLAVGMSQGLMVAAALDMMESKCEPAPVAMEAGKR